ncbi:MAG: glycosyltransferase [Myxococcota bacterium]
MARSESGLRIAHVSGETGFSGGEVQVFLLMEGLRDAGHENLLICPPDSRARAEAEKRGIATASVAMRNDLSLPASWRTTRILREQRPHLVHCHTGRANWVGGLAAWRAGIPALTTRRMDRRVKRGPRTRWLYGRVMRRAAAISPAVATRLEEGGVAADRIRLIWSSVDPATLTPSADRAQLRSERDVRDDDVVLLVTANLVRRKGIDLLIEALARCAEAPGLRLWVVGDGVEKEALEALARERGVTARATFFGRRDDIADWLEACDVFVLPSRLEGLGVAALEAMARARPVVASAVGGLAEVVLHEETGLLVQPEDADALAAALQRMHADAVLRDRLGHAGAQRIRDTFTASKMVEQYVALYREILAETETT